MKLTIYQVDAFADTVFQGNPAAVCPVTDWPDDALLQKIALENNLSETAFFSGEEGDYTLRWFTPAAEVDLCGHATLAAAWVLYNELGEKAAPIRFKTKSGELRVAGKDNTFTLDFPLQPPLSCSPPAELAEALGVTPLEVLVADDYLVLFKNEEAVRNLQPDFAELKKLPKRGVMVTALGDDVDFVSRWFGPNVGVDEDPVTGSSHTTLVPYWAGKLGKNELIAKQVSSRGGVLRCRLDGDRVYITGNAVKYMEGTLYLP